MVDSSRQVLSAASPFLVLVVTPRTTEISPAALSRGVTPPRTSRSISLSLYWTFSPLRPRSTAPPRGTAGSFSPAMAPATAAAARPLPLGSAGATSTIRSALSPSARVTSWLTVSVSPPAATPMRSRRAAEAAFTLSRRACCTARVVESHTTTATSSTASSAAKAAA